MNRWTVLVMLLLVCVYGVRLVLGWSRNSGSLDWDEGITTQLKNDLADLVTAQDLHRSAGPLYASDLAALAEYVPSSGVTIVIENASASGWTASASHRFSTRRCSITARQQRPGELAVLDPPTCTRGRVTAAWNQFHTIKPRTQRFLELLVTVLDRSTRPSSVPLVPPGCRAEQVRGAALERESDLGYPQATTDRIAVRQMLMDGAFNRLEQLLDAYADSVRRDYRVEYRLFDGYAALEAAVPALEPRLDAWVGSHPGSTAARLFPRLRAPGGFAACAAGEVLRRRGDAAGALAAYKRSRATADFWEFRLGRGTLYYRMKRYRHALEDFEGARAQQRQHLGLLDD